MIYEDEKWKEMARSILPSKERKMARARKTRAKRKARRAIRQQLKVVTRDPDWEPADDIDLRRYPYGEIRAAVNDRREADKLAHFLRWAVITTGHLDDPGARLATIRSILPRGLVGDHAVLHLRGLAEFQRHRNPWRGGGEAVEAIRDRIRSMMVQVVESAWAIDAVNLWIRLHHRPVTWQVMGHRIPYRIYEEGRWKTAYRDQIVSVDVGDRNPPRLASDPYAFLETIWRATRRPVFRRYTPRQAEEVLRANAGSGLSYSILNKGLWPDPEHDWISFRALEAFGRLWVRTNGDRGSIRQALEEMRRVLVRPRPLDVNRRSGMLRP